MAPPKRLRHSSPARAAIVQRLAGVGVPLANLDDLQTAIVSYVMENQHMLSAVVTAILPADTKSPQFPLLPGEDPWELEWTGMRILLKESLSLLQWLMFQGEPTDALKQRPPGTRSVCGAIWGANELAYHCRTCEHDSTCAICVPCFNDGDHKDHDYSIIYTNGGCCDCGDETAWKREGFCSKHKGVGVGKIEPLPDEVACSVGAVMDVLFPYWREKLESLIRNTRDGGRSTADTNFANGLSYFVPDMLINFSNCSESMLSFISRKMYQCLSLLDVLLGVEMLLNRKAVGKVREMLFKFMGEPLFKYEFAKAFIRYYPKTVSKAIRNIGFPLEDSVVSMFSVQIFTVPTLIQRLIKESDLLIVLFRCLQGLFIFNVGEDGFLQASKVFNIFEVTLRLVEDIRFVISHDEIPKFIIAEQSDILRTWMMLLSLVQGMDAQKRVTSIHVLEENEVVHTPFVLCHCLGKINILLAEGALSMIEPSVTDKCMDENGKLHHSKIGKSSEDSYVCDAGSTNSPNYVNFDRGKHFDFPSSVKWLISKCLKAMDNWFALDGLPRDDTFPNDAMSNYFSGKIKKSSRIKKKNTNYCMHCTTTEDWEVSVSTSGRRRLLALCFLMGIKERCLGEDERHSIDMNGSIDISGEHVCATDVVNGNLMEVDAEVEAEKFKMLSLGYWSKIAYDVSSQEISFHIPLHRLLSLLLRKLMSSCPTIGSMEPQHDFFRHVLVGCHPYGFASFMMEHPLRLRVFCAQVRAGMWRKNGYAATLSSEYYHTMRWFEQGPESDLFLLQCCASLAPPDLFVQRIQERYGLSNYISLDLTAGNEYEPVLVQDMLILIIQIIKERRFCGFSTIANLRRELIHKLASDDATHSQILKALPSDLSKSDMLQSILNMLSEFSNPSGMKQGKYSLRKECWKELDLYHPRWNSRDLQLAEERYFQFCEVPAHVVQLPRWLDVFYPLAPLSRIATSLTVCRIVRSVLFYALSADDQHFPRAPVSVLLTALHLLSLSLDICEKNHVSKSEISSAAYLHQFEGCSNMNSTSNVDLHPLLSSACKEFMADTTEPLSSLKHQSILSLLVSLMKKFRNEDGHYSGKRHIDISTLIENLLKKFAELNPDCMAQLMHLSTNIIHTFQHSSSTSGERFGSSSDSELRRVKLERQAAIMERIKAEQFKFLSSLEATTNADLHIQQSDENISCQGSDHDAVEHKPVCSLCLGTDLESPLCYLVLLQNSRLATFVERGTLSWNKLDKETHTAAKKAQYDTSVSRPVGSLQLEHTYDVVPAEGTFPDLFEKVFPGFRSTLSQGEPSVSSPDFAVSLALIEEDIYDSILRDMKNMEFCGGSIDSNVCSTSDDVTGSKQKNAEPTFLAEYVSSSSRAESKQHYSHIYRLLCVANAYSKLTSSTCDSNGQNAYDGIFISSCGHAVHQECHDRYLLSLKQRYTRGLSFEGSQIVNPDLGEFLCPVCRRIANSILPVLYGFSNGTSRKAMPLGCGTTSASTSRKSSIVDNSHVLQALSLIGCSSRVVVQDRYLKILSGNLINDLEPALEPIIHKLYVLCNPAIYDTLAASDRLSASLALWDMLRYSIISTEIGSRSFLKTGSVGSNKSFKSLSCELLSSNGFILSLLLRTCRTTCSKNSEDLVMRLRGIRLLAGSICSGVSVDSSFLNGDTSGGLHKKSIFSDVQFWKRMSDPILAHDPFSSLMWVLFCLPLPFLSANQLLTSLVQLFYVVCLIQAMITCYSTNYFDMSCFDGFLLNDVCKLMSNSECTRHYFVSNYVDDSCHPKNIIRKFTFPYLRRCVLLWNLIESSRSSPLGFFHDNAEERGNLTHPFNNDTLDGDGYLADEFNCIIELEEMFLVPSLETFLNDRVVHTLALKWCEHFFKESSVRKLGEPLRLTPAVTFRLMQLPHVYQDLLQRYIKLECSNCKSVPSEPALCLICGKLCSSNWKRCCSASTCKNHAMACGAGIGVFLLVKRTTILLQRSSRQAVWSSLYLDAFGEEDIDVARGKPLYLSEERYTALTYLVASHGLDQNSEVLRQTTFDLYGSD